MSTATETTTKVRLKTPKLYKVILLNDNYTPMDFVIQILLEIFGKSAEEAEALTMTIHKEEKGVIGTYTREIAEQKLAETHNAASHYGHPLKGKVEPE